MTRRRLQLLMLEDSDDDAFLLRRELTRGGFDLDEVRVDSEKALREVLHARPYDIVITDYAMPTFTGIDALAVVRESGLDLPVIMLSGTLGEDAAVQALQNGAEDFVVKGRLARLVPAIERALREASERRDKREAEARAERAGREKAEAEAATKAKSDFIAHVSHELRTPLNAILGFADLLEQGVDGELGAKQREHVRNIGVSGRHLLALINDILDAAKVEAGRMELARKSVSLAAIAEQVRATLMPLVEKKRVTLAVQIPEDLPQIFVDPLRVRQVLYNLLSNAAKFTDAPGRIELAARLDEGRLRITVRDTGIGMDPADLPRLFHSFEQIAPDERAQVEGTGLGLSLTRRLVELHGGTIWAESEKGRGSTFTVMLPETCVQRDVMPVSVPAPAPVTRPPDAKLCVLVVEDDAASRTLARVLLERRGHEVLCATSATEACEQLRTRAPDIVLTDVNIAGGGGERVLDEVRSASALASVPVVAITAHAMGGVRERLLSRGFDGYLSKPIDTRAFAGSIEGFVREGHSGPKT